MPASRREAHAALTQSSPRRGRRGAVERGIARRPRIHQGPLAKKGGETRRAGGPLAQSSTLRPNRSPSPFASGSFLALDTKRAAQRAAPPFVLACDAKLEGLYVRGLETLGALGHFEFNRLAIVQCLVAISHNGGEVDENVLAALALDEPKALAGIEPLYGTLFFIHCFYSFLSAGLRLSTTLSYLMPKSRAPHRATAVFKLVRWAAKRSTAQKKAASVTLRPLSYPKAIQEQQTQKNGNTD